MAQPKYTLYKYIKLSRGKWRYCRADRYKNHMFKRNSVIVGEKEGVHSEGDSKFPLVHRSMQNQAI
jgi:hypothetical protein